MRAGFDLFGFTLPWPKRARLHVNFRPREVAATGVLIIPHPFPLPAGLLQ